MKDGNPLQYGPNLRNLTAEGMSIIEINNLTTDHTGEYKCVARNNNCEISTSCYLKVYDAKTEGDQEAPLFVLSMRGEYRIAINHIFPFRGQRSSTHELQHKVITNAI